jgi:hypothetical protein
MVAACLGDPVGPGVLTIATEGAAVDTVWVGAPGEALPSEIRLRVTDDAGRPLAAASVTWEAVGRNAHVLAPTPQTDAAGLATAGWLLGTDAAEEQHLHVSVRTPHHEREVLIRARAVPHIVSQIRVLTDTPAVLRVGDTLHLNVDAVDPYGNVFPAPDLTISLDDSTLGSGAGAVVVGGPRRGRGTLRITSHGVGATLPLHVTQFVAAIVPARDTVVFSSLGAEWPIAYIVHDDRGRIIADTLAALSVSDTTVVRLNGSRLQSLTSGAASLQVQLGLAVSEIHTIVDQRIATLSLLRDTIRFDALLDTTTIRPIARDSLGFYVPQPGIVFQVQDEQVVEMAATAILKAVTPGVTLVTVLDPETGIYTTVPVVVHQLVRDIEVPQVAFDALGDTIAPLVTPRDRLGSPVADAGLEYSISDTTVVGIGMDGKLHSVGPGRVQFTVRDPETGTATSTDVVVQQRIATLSLDVDSLTFDALLDTARVRLVGRDRLGAIVADAGERTSYFTTDPLVIGVSPSGAVHSAGNGSALVIAQSSDGPADTVRVEVAQRVAALVLDQDSVLFESLHAEAPIVGAVLDRQGMAVAGVSIVYLVEDTTIARVDEEGRIHALGNGLTRLIVSAGGIDVPVTIRIAQRAVRVLVPEDTIHLSAFGDTGTITGVAVDSLGSPVNGEISTLAIGDTSIIDGAEPLTVRARGNGTTTVTFGIAGVTGSTVVTVKQVASTVTASLVYDRPIVTEPAGAGLQLDCRAFDHNGSAIANPAATVSSLRGTVNGPTCDGLMVTRSGLDTLTVTVDSSSYKIAVTVAVQAGISSLAGEYLSIDSFPSGASPWAPTVWRAPNGQVELFTTVYYPDSTRPGSARGHLHRYVSDDGLAFRYDGVVLQHDADPCALNGSGIENVAIVPRQDSAGWRMFFAGGSFNCYGWQVFSAVSNDGRNWVKEPGIRLSNGGSVPPAASQIPPYPVGEGMSIDLLPTGELRMIVGSFEHVDPPPQAIWQIAEWRSTDQVNWTYVDVVLTTRDMPAGGQGSVYSPSIVEIAPGLWRMFFTADNRPDPASRSTIWAAVSIDRKHWVVEGQVAGASNADLYYTTVLDDHLYFIRKNFGTFGVLSVATLEMR